MTKNNDPGYHTEESMRLTIGDSFNWLTKCSCFEMKSDKELLHGSCIMISNFFVQRHYISSDIWFG
jgi:hypothetical protein